MVGEVVLVYNVRRCAEMNQICTSSSLQGGAGVFTRCMGEDRQTVNLTGGAPNSTHSPKLLSVASHTQALE